MWRSVALPFGTAEALLLAVREDLTDPGAVVERPDLFDEVITGLLFDVAPIDPATLAAVAVILAAVALSATLLPALRASRFNPVVALREE